MLSAEEACKQHEQREGDVCISSTCTANTEAGSFPRDDRSVMEWGRMLSYDVQDKTTSLFGCSSPDTRDDDGY